MSEQKNNPTLAIISLIISGLYLLNLSAGVVEIPDNLPIIGNLDELIFANIFIGALARLGIDLRPFVPDQKKKQAENEANDIEDKQ